MALASIEGPQNVPHCREQGWLAGGALARASRVHEEAPEARPSSRAHLRAPSRREGARGSSDVCVHGLHRMAQGHLRRLVLLLSLPGPLLCVRSDVEADALDLVEGLAQARLCSPAERIEGAAHVLFDRRRDHHRSIQHFHQDQLIVVQIALCTFEQNRVRWHSERRSYCASQLPHRLKGITCDVMPLLISCGGLRHPQLDCYVNYHAI
mmetsp:Transcript_37468/g.95881  ORF Transcript_37468/g.95881 Transcript_37468/m.95881 type:complete len:209 (+) Transcript_37468:814-1440(+)